MNDQLAFFTVGIPLFGAIFASLAGLWRAHWCQRIAQTAIVGTAIVTVGLFLQVNEVGAVHYQLGGGLRQLVFSSMWIRSTHWC